MSHRIPVVLAMCVLGIAVTSGAGLAAARAVGDQFVYTLQTTIDAPPPNMPAGMPAGAAASIAAQIKQTRAMENGTIIDLTLKVDALNADGSAHATGTAISKLPAGTNPIAQRIMAQQGQDLTANILADGAIEPKYEAPAAPAVGATQAEQSAQAAQIKANYAAGLVVGRLRDFNEFALGCSKRSTFKTGDAWRLVDKQSATWTFTVTGTDQVAGHSVDVITMTSDTEGQSYSSKSTATGDFDATQHVLVRFHEETDSTNSAVPGTTKTTDDIALQ